MSLFYYHSNLQIHRKSVVNICKNFVFARLKNAKGHSIAANTTFKKIKFPHQKKTDYHLTVKQNTFNELTTIVSIIQKPVN